MRFPLRWLLVPSSVIGFSLAFCSGCDTGSNSDPNANNGQGGSPASGGSGNPASGGSPGQGGAATSGGTANASGGSSNSAGGSAQGGSSNGGSSNGGSSNGGSSNGGSSNGGGQTASGGSAQGGSNTSAGGKTGGGAGGVSGGASGGSNGGAPIGGNAGASSGGCTKGGDTIFCEDFESVPAGTVAKTNGYSPVTSNGTLMVDSTHARGMRSMHVHTDGNGHAYIQLSPFAPPSNSFFGRMYIWVTAFPTAPDYAHFTLVEAAAAAPVMDVIRPIGGQYISGKGDLWGTGSDHGATGDWTNWKESAPAQAGKWLCMEWEMTAADNNINVWIDSTAKPELSVSTKMHGGNSVDFVFPQFNSVWFGWWLYQSGPTPNQFDLWIDDISLGTKRQGC